jgi:hypothetical protein
VCLSRCCICFKYMLQVFLSRCCVCVAMIFKCFSHVFARVADACFKCFICFLYATIITPRCFKVDRVLHIRGKREWSLCERTKHRCWRAKSERRGPSRGHSKRRCPFERSGARSAAKRSHMNVCSRQLGPLVCSYRPQLRLATPHPSPATLRDVPTSHN